MQLGVLYQAGQGAIMHGDDPAAAEEQVQLGGFGLPLLLAQQWMNGHVDVIFKRFDFGPLVLLNDVL